MRRTDTKLVTLDDIREARERLLGVVVRTPLIPFPRQNPDRRLYFKPESFQPTGAFKLRGAYNKIASLSEEERRRGVISHSSGNHAQAVAYAARELGVRAVIVMPRGAPRVKLEATQALGAEVVLVDNKSEARKRKNDELAAEFGYVPVPPYDDSTLIAGQGTIGLEILEDLADVGLVLVPVSGGGLISGVAAALKLSRPDVQVIGVEPSLAADAQASFRGGHIVSFPAEQTWQTIADGLRVQQVGLIPWAHLQAFVDDIVTVEEDEIGEAVRRLAFQARLVSEPSGAVTFAAWLFHSDELPRTPHTVALISGGNIDPHLLAEILNEPPLTR